MSRDIPGWWLEVSNGYLRSLRRRNRRPNTELTYRTELFDFGEWLQARGVQSLQQLEGAHIEAWQDDMHGRLAMTTQRVASTAARGVLKWAALQGMALSTPNLWLHVVTPKVPPMVPRPIPSRDLAILLGFLGPSEPCNLFRLRTRALFLVIFSSGARISEALSLGRASICDGMAVVTQKGGRPHALLISDAARAAIADYERARSDHSGALFASLHSRRPGQPLRRKEAQEGWNRLCCELGIAPFKSHQIRHSCATMLRKQRVDIALIARHLGHRGLQTIMGYAEIDMEERRRAVELLDARLVS